MRKILLLPFLLLLFACPMPDGDEIQAVITVRNNSTSNIYIQLRGLDPVLYTWAPNENYFIPIDGVFEAGGNYYSSLSSDGLEYIWLFDENVINNYSWEDIVENEMYLIRYDLSLQDLEDMNWEIVYDGN